MITVAVAGNPNSGKSTLINAIAGSRLHVGNWPGVTVEKKEAVFEREGKRIKLIDLPGTYSLSPYTQEEIIARDYLVCEKPDVIINVVDSTNLERNLYLTVQLLELGRPVIIALNIYDEAKKKGYRIDTTSMEEMLDVKVVVTVATERTGLNRLLAAVLEVAGNSSRNHSKQLDYGEDLEAVARVMEQKIKQNYNSLAKRYPLRWFIFKLLEGDGHVLKEINGCGDGLFIDDHVQHLRKIYGDDIESIMANVRYAKAAETAHRVLSKPEVRKIELTEKIDSIVLNRFLGVPIFLGLIWFVFKLTFDVSTPFVDWIDAVVSGPLKRRTVEMLGMIHTPAWTVSLATDGVIAGVGFVIMFVPVIFTMMFFITFLEGSGYMARAAFVMDRAMRAIGLHGKAFIPMVLGFGCNVPAICATRILENSKDRILTALLIPLMSCGARLPIYVLFVGTFFPVNSGTVLWSLYVMGIVLAIVMGIFFKKTIFKGEPSVFIMELPPYRMPSFKTLMVYTWERGKHFLVKAGTYILLVSILVWFLLNFPWGVEHKKDSYLGKVGQVVAIVFKPLGFGSWDVAASLVTGVIAKEIVVGTMGEIYVEKKEPGKKEQQTFTGDLKECGMSLTNAMKDSAKNVFSTFWVKSISIGGDKKLTPLRAIIQGTFTPLSAYAFLAFVLLYMPCIVASVAMRNEFGTWKWVGISFTYQIALGWIVAFAIYQGGKMLGIG
jgi:ferrous iron transport protein B